MGYTHCVQYYNGYQMQNNTLETTYKALLEVERGIKTKTQIAKDFDVPLNTLST